MGADGFLNLLKPPGMTSHDAVAWLRRRAGVATGHAGTLDRAAAGVLVLCVGAARRFSRFAMEGDKAYVGEITFGVTTDTLDAEGTVLSERDASAVTGEKVARVLEGLEGEIEQRAPAYSAVHVGGERLYELARRGETPNLPTRRVRIITARLLDFTPGRSRPFDRLRTAPANGRRAVPSGVEGRRTGRHPRARVAVECSKGTYLRSLAADIGAALECGAYLSFLVRTRAGAFDIADSLTIEEVQETIEQHRLASILRPLDEPLSGLPAVKLDEREARLVRCGSLVPAPPQVRRAPNLVRLYDAAGGFIGLAQADEESLRPRIIVPSPALDSARAGPLDSPAGGLLACGERATTPEAGEARGRPERVEGPQGT